MSGSIARPNPWAGAVILKLAATRSGRPICYFTAHFPLMELAFTGCTLWLTRAGKLWASPPKQKRALSDGTTQYDDIVEWDGGGAASRFSSACLEAIERHSPELLRPQLEGQAAPAPLALAQPRRDTKPVIAPPHAPDWWERDR